MPSSHRSRAKSPSMATRSTRSQEGLARLNVLRKSFDLHPITVRWHNYYMPEKKLLSFANKNFKVEAIENIGNLYYIISRVVYAKLAQIEGKEPEYGHPINKIARRPRAPQCPQKILRPSSHHSAVAQLLHAREKVTFFCQ